MTNSPSASVLTPGTVLAGKFCIEQVLGQGGMGVVVAARHLQLDERVALKFLLPEALSNAEAVARFAREARAAVKIKSEHVARVTDVGTLETGSPYMVMEYLRGTDLGDLVHTQGPLPIADAVEYLLQACEAVAEAHALGIVHRDLKPSNLFLTRRADGSPSIKVLDFGISKVTTGADSQMNMTRTATVMGSPLYMSPEQMASARDVDTRTDIWAIGAILYELLTGQVPFNADTMPQLCAKILQEEAPALRNARPDAPDGLQEVVRRCLQKKPVDRYPSVAELAAALLPFAPSRSRLSVERITKVIAAAGLSESSLALPQSQSANGVSAGTTQQAWGTSQATHRGGAKWVALAGLAVAVGVAVAALSGAFGSSESEASRTQAAPSDLDRQSGTPAARPSAPDVVPATATETTQPKAQPSVAPPEASTRLPPEPAAGAPSTTTSPPAPTFKAAAKVPKVPRAAPRPSKPPPPEPKQEPKAQVPAVDLYQDRK